MHVLVLAVLYTAAIDAPAGDSRPIWTWTIEERIAARLDPRAVLERAAVDEMGEPPAGIPRVRQAGRPPRVVVDGMRHPELFLPFELFNSLFGSLGDERSRAEHDTDLAAAGWDQEAFWKTIEELTAEYRRRSDALAGLEARMPAMTPPERRQAESVRDRESIALCGLRADALQRAREHFGAEAFDRFLYTSVAPKIRIGSSVAPDEQERRRLLYVEGGCR